MTSIASSTMQNYFTQYDTNNDKRMSGQELAYASTNLTLKGASAEAGIFAKMAPTQLGGEGLLPDFNHDGALDQGELARLTNMYKNDNRLGGKDFNKLFPGGSSPFPPVANPNSDSGYPTSTVTSQTTTATAGSTSAPVQGQPNSYTGVSGGDYLSPDSGQSTQTTATAGTTSASTANTQPVAAPNNGTYGAPTASYGGGQPQAAEVMQMLLSFLQTMLQQFSPAAGAQ